MRRWQGSNVLKTLLCGSAAPRGSWSSRAARGFREGRGKNEGAETKGAKAALSLELDEISIVSAAFRISSSHISSLPPLRSSGIHSQGRSGASARGTGKEGEGPRSLALSQNNHVCVTQKQLRYDAVIVASLRGSRGLRCL